MATPKNYNSVLLQKAAELKAKGYSPKPWQSKIQFERIPPTQGAPPTGYRWRPPIEHNDPFVVGDNGSNIPEGWDWKTSPTGINGETLPPKAVGWTATGEPAFQQGLSGWWDEFVWKITRPRSGTPTGDFAPITTETTTPEQQQRSVYGALPETYKKLDVGQTTSNLNQYIADAGEEGARPSVPQMAVRAAGQTAKSIVGAFGIPAQKFEQGAFGAQRGLEAAGEGSPLPELLPNSPEWAKNLAYLLPIYRGYNSVRTLTSPMSLSEKEGAFDPEYEAGRIAYSSVIDPLRREEFKRLLGEGYTPTQAEMATANPIAELVGELLLDPLNVAGVIGKPAHLTRQIDAAKEYYELAGDLAKAANYLDDVEDVAAVSKLDDLVQAEKVTSNAVRQGLNKFAGDTSIFAVTSGGKRYQVTRRAGEVARHIVTESKNPDHAADMIEAVAKMVGGDDAEIAEAFASIKHFVTPRVLLSEAAQELGIIVRQVIGETDTGKLADGKDFLAALKGIDDPEEIIKIIDKRITPVIDKMFPTVSERTQALKDGQKLKIAGIDLRRPTPATMALTKFDNVMQKAIYKPLNSFFAGMYMGLSPGYAARNIMSNMTHVAVDYGVGAFKKGPRGWADNTASWLGRRKEAIGFGGPAGGGNTWEAAKGLPFQKLSAVGEKLSGDMAIGVAVDRAMRKMLKPGRSLPSLQPLVDAGMSPKAAQTMARSIVDNYGDVGKAVDSFISTARKGNIDAFESLAWLADGDIHLLHEYGINDNVLNAVREGYKQGKSMDDILADVRSVRDEWLAKAKSSADDIPQINPELTLGKEDVLSIKGIDDGVAKDGVIAEASNFYTSLSNTTDEYASAINKIAAQIDTPEVNRAYRVWHGQYQPKLHESNVQSQEWTQNWVANKYRDTWLSQKDTLDLRGAWQQMVDEARKYGVELGDAPSDWKGFSSGFWEKFYYPVKQKYWSAVREDYVQSAEQLARTWPEFAGKEDILRFARENEAYARAIDDTIPPPILKFKKDAALENGDVGSYAWLVAKQYRMESPTDAHILSAVNKYGGKEYKHISEADPKVIEAAFLKRLEDKSAVKVAQAAPDVWYHGTRSGEAFKIEDANTGAADLGVYITKDRNLAEKYTSVDVHGEAGTPRILEVAATPKKTLEMRYGIASPNEIGAVADRLASKIPIDEIWADRVLKKIDDAKKGMAEAKTVEQWKTAEAKLYDAAMDISKNTGGNAFSVVPLRSAITEAGYDSVRKIDDGADTLVAIDKKILSTAQAAPEAAKAAEELPLAYAPGAVPSHAQWAAPQTQGMTDLFNRIEKGVRDNWGKTYSVDMSPGTEKALADWAKTATKRVSEARLIASKVGDAARDFTLLSYPEKRYFDLALAYVYPFHFWYGRTYAHWMQRLAYNADIVAAYSKYTKALEQIHAGAPDWWKYSINTNELLGIESDHPFFFNLQTTLNPVNGLTGVDFDDPLRRPNWWTALLDDMNKFGPTLWTPISLATALILKNQGEDEAAARWAGRLVPQTAALKSALSLMNVNRPTGGGGINEYDPAVQFFSGGMDPYERRRVGRKLYDMEADGYSEAEIIDAANFQDGPVWLAAAEKAIRERAKPQLAGTLFGWSWKARTASDMEIDKFYQDYYRFWGSSGTRSPEEVRLGLEQMRQKYPFMDTVILSRKTGFARDRSYAYNVLARIPPGQKDDLFEMAGLSPDYMDKFYASKGDISKWKQTDRDKFMAGIVDLGARLDMPNTATREEWNQVKSRYTAIDDGIKEQWGDDMLDRISLFYTFQNKEDGYTYLDNNPDVQEAMNWKDSQIINDPLMKAYYSSVDKIERYYKNMMYEQMETKYGKNIWDVEQGYYDAKLTNSQKQYLRQHPELIKMWDDKDIYKQLINSAIIRAAQNTTEIRRPNLRPTVPESMGEIGVDMGIGAQQQERTIYDYTWDDFAPMMSEPMQRLVIEYAADGKELSYAAQSQLDYIASQIDADPELLLQLMVNSLSR